MMNWLKVIFDGARVVYVNGKILGDTNEPLFLGEDGTYTFDLGEPRNYHPGEQTLAVSGTSKRHPLIIKFDKE